LGQRIPGLYNDPNEQYEVWANPNQDPFSEFGDEGFSLSGQASGSIDPSGWNGSASGGASSGYSAPAGPSGPGFGAMAQHALAVVRAGLPAAHPAVIHAAIASHPAVQYANRMRGHTRNREMLLEPNRDSTTKVERFVFAISDVVAALGTGQAISLRDTPDTNIRPQRVTMNAVSPGMFLISQIRVGNVDASVGGDVDAWDFNANGQGQSLDMPTLKTSTKVTVSGTYTGLVPSPLTGTGPYTFTVSFKGPATLTA
jgi:hypothetical protein